MQSLSFKVAKCLPRYCRTMSTANDQKILTEAFNELGLAKPASGPPQPAPPTITTSTRPSSPPILDIPPAEDPLLRYLTSSLTQHGHRARAARIVSQTLMHLHAWTRAPPLPILRQAILDAAPAVRTLNHRQGGKTIYKPVALGEKQRTRKAVQAILTQVEKKQGRLPEKLAREIMGILRGDKDNAVLRKKDEMHRHAMVNRCVLYSTAKKMHPDLSFQREPSNTPIDLSFCDSSIFLIQCSELRGRGTPAYACHQGRILDDHPFQIQDFITQTIHGAVQEVLFI